MASIGDLTVGIRCDPTELTAGMTQVREQLNQTTTVIQVQDTTWRSFSETVVGSIARIAVPALKLVNTYKQIQLATIALAAAQAGAIPPTLTLAGAMGFLLSPITLTVAAIAAVGAAIYYFTSRSNDASKAAGQIGKSADEAVPKLNRLQQTIKSVSAALIGDDNTNAISGVVAEYEKLREKIRELGATIAQPFLDAGQTLKALTFSIIDIEGNASFAVATMRRLGDAVDELKKRASQAGPAFAASVLAFVTGMSELDATELINIGSAIGEQNATIEKLTEQRQSYRQLGEMQSQAAAEAERQAELRRVSSLVTIDAVNAEILALQQQAAQTIASGQVTEAYMQQTEAMFQALEKQRQAIMDGTVVDREAEEQKRALKKAEEDAAKAAADALEKENRQLKSGTDRIMSLRDQIDLLNGSATRAEIAMREMARQGYSQEQINEVGMLMDELDRLEQEEKKRKDKKSSGSSSAAAITAGSREALSIIAKAANDSRSPELAEAKKHTELLQQNNDMLGDLPDQFGNSIQFHVANIA